MRALLRRPDVAVVALLVVAASVVFGRALGTRTNYDEGVYLASLQLVRHGDTLGSDIYTPQPPIFYWLLRILSAPFGDSIPEIRAGLVALAIVGVIAAYATARQLFGLWAGAAAGLLLIIAPPFPTNAAVVAADVPSLALGLVALALVARGVQPGASRGWAAGAGVAAALAILTKFLAAPFLVPLLVIPLARRAHRRVLPFVILGGVAATAVVVIAYSGSLGELWRGTVTDHEGAKGLSRVGDNIDRLEHLLELRTPIGWLVPAGVVAFILSRSARSTWPLATIVPAAALFTLYSRPLSEHQLALMACAWAIAAGPALALGIQAIPWSALQVMAAGLAAALIAAGVYQEQHRQVVNAASEPPEVIWAAAAVAATVPVGERFVTDVPIVSFRSGRLIPGYLTDTSVTRVNSGALDAAGVLRAINESHSSAVFVGRTFAVVPGLLPEIERRFPVAIRCGYQTLYLRARPLAPPPKCPLAVPS